MSSPVERTFQSLSEALEDAFVRQRTGVLICGIASRTEVFHVLSGDLYLSGTNPCRDRLEVAFAEPPNAEQDVNFDPRAYLDRELSLVVKELSATLASWQIESLQLREGLDDVPDDIVGPVPTADLVRDLATRGRSFDSLLRRIGGREASYRALPDYRLRQRIPYLDTAELALLERLGKRDTVGRLIEKADAAVVIRQLVRLISVGLVEAVDEPGPLRSAMPADALVGISQRVAADLDTRPLRLEPALHRAQIETMLESYGRLGYYELLGVGSNTPPDEVHTSFMELARLAHPRHAAELGLESSRGQLERLMARLTEAYLVLSDPERAAEYRGGRGVLKPPERVGDSPQRRAEKEDVALQSYRAALDFIEAEDYFYAIELLVQATRANERPEYYVMLGHCQRKNPKWLHMAIDSFRRALALSPDDEEVRQYLADATREYREYREAQKTESEAVAESPDVAEGPDAAESPDARRTRRALSRLLRR